MIVQLHTAKLHFFVVKLMFASMKEFASTGPAHYGSVKVSKQFGYTDKAHVLHCAYVILEERMEAHLEAEGYVPAFLENAFELVSVQINQL